MSWFLRSQRIRIYAVLNLRSKKKCLVSSYPTDPNILGPTQTFFEAFWNIKVYFRLFFKYFFPYTNVFLNKDVCLPTNPKTLGGVTGSKTRFFLLA